MVAMLGMAPRGKGMVWSSSGMGDCGFGARCRILRLTTGDMVGETLEEEFLGLIWGSTRISEPTCCVSIMNCDGTGFRLILRFAHKGPAIGMRAGVHGFLGVDVDVVVASLCILVAFWRDLVTVSLV